MKRLLWLLMLVPFVADAQPIIQRLRQLRDVDVSSPAANDTLQYDATSAKWVPGSSAGTNRAAKLYELQAVGRSAGMWSFYDDFERADTDAGVIGTSTSGFPWQFLDTSPPNYPGTNVWISNGRLRSDADGTPTIFYAVAQSGLHKPMFTRMGAEIVWTDRDGTEASQATLALTCNTNAAISWGIHTRINRSGWALGYITGAGVFVDKVSELFLTTLEFGQPYYFEATVDPQGCTVDFAGVTYRDDDTNYWYYSQLLNPSTPRNWAIWEHYSNDLNDMTDFMEFESVWAGGSYQPPAAYSALTITNLTADDVTVSGTVSAASIVQGTDTLDDLLATKAASDVLDTGSVGSLGAPGTNTVVSAFDDLMIRRTVDWPATALTGGAVEIDWATEAVKAITATGALSITDANRPTAAHWVTGYGSITNSSLSDVSIAWPSEWTPVTGVELTNLVSEYTAFCSWTWDGSKVWYSYETRQTEPLSDAYGGTGRSSLTENAVMVGAGTGPIKLLSLSDGVSVSTNNIVGWDAAVKATHTNDDVVKLWEIAVPTNKSFHGYADVRSSGGSGGMLRYDCRGGFWRDGDAGLAHRYTNSTSYGESGGNAYWYTNNNSAALYVVGIDSANWRTWAGIRYDLTDNPDVAAPTYNVLWDEGFEGTGTEETYASTAGTQWDFDNTAQYAYGAQSGYHTNSAERHNMRTTTITNLTQSARMSVRINAWPKADGALRLMLFGDAASSYQAQFSITSTGKLRATAWAVSDTTTESVPTNTWFHVWAEMVTDTTDNVSMKVGFSADTTKPTSGDSYYASASTTGRTFTPNRILFPDVLNTAYDDGEVWIDGVLIIDGDYDDLPGAYPE